MTFDELEDKEDDIDEEDERIFEAYRYWTLFSQYLNIRDCYKYDFHHFLTELKRINEMN